MPLRSERHHSPKITIIYLLILAFPEGRGLADLFMLFRESMFFVIGIPAIYLTLRSILFLRRGSIASSRIFLRREMMIKASRFLLLSSTIGVLGAGQAYIWSITGLDILRISGGLFLIGMAALIFLYLLFLNRVLR